MPRSTMEDEPNWPLDADTPYRAVLMSVEEKTTPGGISRRTGNEYSAFTSWIWKFEVTEGPKAGQWAWADTEDRLTTREDNKVRKLGEALRREPYALGEGIDTDDLSGLECYIVVANDSYTKGDGTTGYKCPIVDAYPLDDENASSRSSEPPF